MASVKSSNNRIERGSAHPHMALQAGTLPNKQQCLANSDAVPCTRPCMAANPSALISDTNHVSQSLQNETADVTNSISFKTKCSPRKTMAADNSSKSTPENASCSVTISAAINNYEFISECDLFSTNKIDSYKVQVPAFKKKLSKRKHGLIQNAAGAKYDPTNVCEIITPFNCSSGTKRKYNMMEQSGLQKKSAECYFSQANIKTDPEELSGFDSQQNLHPIVQRKNKRTCQNMAAVNQRQEQREDHSGKIYSAVPHSSLEFVSVKTEQAEEPLLEMPWASTTNDPLAENIKTEQDNEDSINDFALAPANRKKVTSASKTVINSIGYTIVSNLVQKLNAPPSIIDEAFSLFKKVAPCGIMRSRATAIASSCVYFLCRQDGVPRTFQEIAAISKVSKKELGRCFKFILKCLDTSLTTLKTDDFMCRFCHSLGLGDEVIEAAECIANEATRMDLVSRRSPVSVATGAIFMASQASGVPRSALEISKATGVSEATVLGVYRSIYPYARVLFPPNFKFRKSIENLTTTPIIF
ncbi:Transcription factor TFIIB cyclin-like domain [Trinorchestia longiramus]|nr:Transcription factor TFIIB cyclin-like domain [Trinorchestia longiramus]